ncbi:MAG: hypothetical protein ABSA11_14225 [Candidatus Bathyarchaeia archaeon]
MLNVPDQDESLYRALKARNLRIEVDFSGIADVGEATRIITVRGNATTGFLHGPGEGILEPADFPIKGSLNSRDVPRASQTYVSLAGTLGSTRARSNVPSREDGEWLMGACRGSHYMGDGGD